MIRVNPKIFFFSFHSTGYVELKLIQLREMHHMGARETFFNFPFSSN